MCLSAPRQSTYQPTTTAAPTRVPAPARPATTVPASPAPATTSPSSSTAVEPRVGRRPRRDTGIFSNIRTTAMGDPLFGGNTQQRARFGGVA